MTGGVLPCWRAGVRGAHVATGFVEHLLAHELTALLDTYRCSHVCILRDAFKNHQQCSISRSSDTAAGST
jgi:hypothetical protein